MEEITDLQIEGAVGVYRTLLQENRGMLGSAVIQQLLAEPAYAATHVGVLRKCIKAINDLAGYDVSTDASRTPEEVLKATDRTPLVIKEVMEAMPRGESGIARGVSLFIGLRTKR